MTPTRTWPERLALGTVQFGMAYGVSNSHGQVAIDTVDALLRQAHAAGIRTLDTAAAYGESEEVLGRTLQHAGVDFELISKLPRLGDTSTPDDVHRHLGASLARLGRKSIRGMLFHDFADLQRPDLLAALREHRTQGTVSGIGASLYHPHEARWILDQGLELDLIQLPLNLFDQRFTPLLPALQEAGIEVHARSAFLQGLFFLPETQLRTRFPDAVGPVERVKAISAREGLPLPALLLNFVLAHPCVDGAVIGVTGTGELANNLLAASSFEQVRALTEELTGLGSRDERIILPYNWH